MKTSNPLTAEVFSAFLKCQTKAYLMAVGETPPDAYFANIEERISARFKAAAKQELSIGTSVSEFLEFQRLKYRPDLGSTTNLVDCDSAAFSLSSPPSEQRRQTPRKLPVFQGVVPVLFVPWDKLSISENLLLCFGAVALEQLTGVLPTLGTLVYGEGYRQKNLKIENHLTRTHEIIGSVKIILNAPQPPPLVLNRHCTVCDYQRRCRGIAIERDDLSLLTAMTTKDRMKSNANGVFTITQLS
jgi:CRISPR/Cas system-associated exonuclease Cas4 (RecB family)